MKYLRRAVWFFASRLLVICLILGLAITIFYYAMNLTNIQVILKDGMANRAKFIMRMTDDLSELQRYFQTAWLETDSEIVAAANQNSPYEDYNVRGIDHRLDMDFLWVWPWESTARVTVTERIPGIDGRAKGQKADALVAAGGAKALYPPAWPEARYRVSLVKENGQWKMKNLTPVQ